MRDETIVVGEVQECREVLPASVPHVAPGDPVRYVAGRGKGEGTVMAVDAGDVLIRTRNGNLVKRRLSEVAKVVR